MFTRVRTSMVVLAVALAGCGTGAAPASLPTATTSPSGTPAPLDPCLVGTWKVVAQDESSPANDENIQYHGGTGEVYTIGADGTVTIDTSAAKTLVFKDFNGQTFTGTVAGTGHGTLSTLTGGNAHFFFFTPTPDDTRTTHSVGPDGVELGPARPDSAFTATYTCAPGRVTFYKSSVNYMVDGPIETLTSGSGSPSGGSPSSGASPMPS